MALESDIRVPGLFAGEDKDLEFEIFAEDQDPASAFAVMQNVVGFTFVWELWKASRRIDPHRRLVGDPVISKSSASGITVPGEFHALRKENSQRVRVRLTSDDLANLDATLNYVYRLRRSDPGSRTVLSYGVLSVLA